MSAFKEISMRAKHLVVFTAICFAFCWLTLGKAQTPQQKAPVRVYNTAKQKLKDGKQIVGATVFSPDPTCTARWPMPDTISCGLRCSIARSPSRTLQE